MLGLGLANPNPNPNLNPNPHPHPNPHPSQGVFIDELLPLANQPLLPLHYRDLFLQRQRLVRALQARLGVGVGVERVPETEPPLGDVAALRDGVLRLRRTLTLIRALTLTLSLILTPTPTLTRRAARAALTHGGHA